MSTIVLEGGSDAADVALFSRDHLPNGHASDETFNRLEVSGQALRMKKGKNGHDLLFLYIDEDIPKPTKKFCKLDDPMLYRFTALSGRIGFGGIEATTDAFNPKKHRRQDAEIPAGIYDAVAYRTKYPRNYVEKKIAKRIGRDGMRAVNFPTKIVGYSSLVTVLFVMMAVSLSPIFAIFATLSALVGYAYYKIYTHSPNYRFEASRKREIELKYPSHVIKMALRRR